MAWIEVHQELRWHWKVERLAADLAIAKPHALGCIVSLWLWAAGNARDGQLGRFTPREISAAAGWEGDEQRFRTALTTHQLLDADGGIHDWSEHGLRLLEKARLRIADFRSRTGSHTRSRTRTHLHVRERVSKKESTVRNTTVNRFETFWEAYPRKVGKEAARHAFERLGPADDLLAQMISALKCQRLWPQWVRDGGQFIPHASTWLNGKRWEDAPPPDAAFIAAGKEKTRSIADDLTPEQREHLKRLRIEAAGIGNG